MTARQVAGGLLLLGAAACAGGPAPEGQPLTRGPEPAAPPALAPQDTALSMAAEAAAARAVVAAFVSAEARRDGAADTLLVSGADFIMGGITVTNRPRLAALLGRGEAMVEEARIGTAGALAFVVVVYRFDGASPDIRERARGTFVLERRTAGWRIRHVHTSMVERW